MDLTLSRRGDYVLRAALDLARAWESGEYRKIREVAEEMDLPRSYTPRILSLLAQAGLATARAGRSGGYRLVRAPDDITLLEVVKAGDSDLPPDHCALRGTRCRQLDVCPLHLAWNRATDALKSVLRATSLASIARDDQSLTEGHFPLPESGQNRPVKPQPRDPWDGFFPNPDLRRPDRSYPSDGVLDLPACRRLTKNLPLKEASLA